MKQILLTTLNARYTHTSLALRYLLANLHELQESAQIQEFTINDAIQSVAEAILAAKPRIIGIGVYIWNAKETHELIHILKKVAPEIIIVLGGPEVSHEPFRVDFSHADYIIQGEGEVSFYQLCRDILASHMPNERTIKAKLPSLKTLELPYAFYTDEDIQNRYIYVESSRGCPFLCEFCLSSIDERVRSFHMPTLLKEFEKLWVRGARNFKFIDRTFNINIKTANDILDFFLAKEPPYFAHFEVIPDHFPDSIKAKIKRFSHAALQLEIGIQTLNPQIAENISRPLKLEKIKENIAYLENETEAHMHLDLIVGLPGESLESFGANLDALVALSKSEIQIGILKKLSGTSINRHDIEHGMVYSDIPPYDILKNDLLSFEDIMIMKRFARFWDLFYNSGNFKNSTPLLWKNDSVYKSFYDFGMWIYGQTLATHKISLERQSELLFSYLCDVKHLPKSEAASALINDIARLKGRAIPAYLKPYSHAITVDAQSGSSGFNKRQI
ncbi:MAG: DUF4080 domain-containing protein [Epsilonproteobacteria bacterium]|nr:DUF4080 domain-containing protein [Campylobacterota bacterium]